MNRLRLLAAAIGLAFLSGCVTAPASYLVYGERYHPGYDFGELQYYNGDKEMAVVAIAPVSRKISTKRLASAVGVRNLEPMESALAQKMSGYVLGGISPFGQKKQLATVIDSSAENFETIYVSGGRRGLEISIAPTDLMHALNALMAHIHAK